MNLRPSEQSASKCAFQTACATTRTCPAKKPSPRSQTIARSSANKSSAYCCRFSDSGNSASAPSLAKPIYCATAPQQRDIPCRGAGSRRNRYPLQNRATHSADWCVRPNFCRHTPRRCGRPCARKIRPCRACGRGCNPRRQRAAIAVQPTKSACPKAG